MFSSIFRKQFCVYLGALFVTFLLLGFSMSQFFRAFFIAKEKELLLEQGKIISETFEQKVSNGSIIDYHNWSELTETEKYLDMSYFIMDITGTPLAVSQNLFDEKEGGISGIPKDLFQIKEPVILEGNLGGLYKESSITAIYPLKVNNLIMGFAFLSRSLPMIERSVSEIFRVTLVILCYSGLFAFVLVYISSKSISKPLMEMNDAAKVISNGDFEKRIKVTSKDEVGQLAKSFNSMAESLDKQEHQRREFIANISHDLRSPLTSINGFLQAILDGTIPVESQGRYLEIIMAETTRLSKLANDILDINKLNLLELNLSKFDLNELIRKTIIQFETRLLEKDINIEVSFEEDSTFVYADQEKIQRVLYNLIDNAIKFLNKSGNIFIGTVTKNKKVYVSIKDDGIGISEEDQKRVFERFFKADCSRGMDKQGSGLGLSIIKEFIKAHDEEIILNSKPNEGCEFVFSLKIMEDEEKD